MDVVVCVLRGFSGIFGRGLAWVRVAACVIMLYCDVGLRRVDILVLGKLEAMEIDRQ